MRVTPIRRLELLEPFAETWARLHAQDEHATLFSSWPWLRAWLAERPGEWLVLAVQPDALSPPVAFLGFEVLSGRSRVPGIQNRALRLAGDPDAHLSGMVCDPGREAEVRAALAGALLRWPWRELALRNVRDPRLLALLRGLPEARVRQRLREDYGRSVVALPASLEAYLEGLPGPRRRELRRRSRRAEDAGLVLSQAGSGTFDADLDALLGLVAARFGARAFRDARARTRCRGLLAEGFGQGWVHLTALRREARPVALSVGFLDRERSVYHAYLSAWEPEYAAFAPGTLVKLGALGWACAAGFATFDFGHGDEAYKLELGAPEPERYPRAELLRLRPHERLASALSRGSLLTPRPLRGSKRGSSEL